MGVGGWRCGLSDGVVGVEVDGNRNGTEIPNGVA